MLGTKKPILYVMATLNEPFFYTCQFAERDQCYTKFLWWLADRHVLGGENEKGMMGRAREGRRGQCRMVRQHVMCYSYPSDYFDDGGGLQGRSSVEPL